MNGRSFSVLAGLLVIGAIATTLAFSPATAQTAPGLRTDAAPAPMVERCRHLMAELKILGTEVRELDQRLATKAEPMNTMAIDDRMDAMQAVIEELMAQRRIERQKIKKTHQEVFSHLLQHMMVEDVETRRAWIHACPLVKRIHREPRTGDTAVVDLELKY